MQPNSIYIGKFSSDRVSSRCSKVDSFTDSVKEFKSPADHSDNLIESNFSFIKKRIRCKNSKRKVIDKPNNEKKLSSNA